MDNIKQVIKDIRFLIATDCCDETLQKRIENFINEREQALRIHDVVGRSEQLVCDCPNEEWVYDESGIDMYCKRCAEKEAN